MNLVKTCPNIPDDWKGNIADVSRELGLDRDTIDRYAKLGRKNGGLDWKPSKSGKKQFSGREVKRFWREY